MSVVYRQGGLVVTHEGHGFRVVDDVGQALVGPDGHIRIDGDDEVVGVVAAALSARIRGEAFHLHAGAVRVAGGVVLVAGDSGAGKTTASLALGRAGDLIGDDVCFVRVVGGDVVVRVSARPLHVGDVTLAMFPGLELLDDVVTRAGKRRARLAPHDDDDGRAWWPVLALVFPSIDRTAGARSRASTWTPTMTLPRLLQASAMVTWPGLPHAQDHLDVLGRLARCPAFGLAMGQDARGDVAVIVDVMRRAGLPLEG